MRKTRIEIKFNIVVYIDVYKITRLAIDDQNNKIKDIADINDKVNIDSADVDLVQFSIHNNILLIDNIREIYCK